MCNRCNCAQRYAYLNIPKTFTNNSYGVMQQYTGVLTTAEYRFLRSIRGYSRLSAAQYDVVMSILTNARYRTCGCGH